MSIDLIFRYDYVDFKLDPPTLAATVAGTSSGNNEAAVNNGDNAFFSKLRANKSNGNGDKTTQPGESLGSAMIRDTSTQPMLARDELSAASLAEAAARMEEEEAEHRESEDML